MAQCWSTFQNTSFCLKQWGHEYVVYHKQSGDTHLLDEVGIAVLNYLQKNTADSDTILEYLVKAKHLEVDATQLQELLASFSRYGLIDKVP
jgi:PqqD family protein of HPr-rel-A system